MQVRVLEAFDYAHDGVKMKRLEAGETAHIRDELVKGLKDGGFVGDLDAKPAKGAAAPPAKGAGKPDEAPASDAPAPEDPPKA